MTDPIAAALAGKPWRQKFRQNNPRPSYEPRTGESFAEGFARAGEEMAPNPLDAGEREGRMMRDLLRMGEPMTLDQAAVATSGVPVLGDVLGLAADARAIYDDPSAMNIGGAALGALPFVPAMAAIRAFHGSPHDFDKFDMSKIGTGEGNQAYGHGLYFAEAEDAAKSYRDSVSLSKSGNLDWDDPGTVATFWVRNTGSRADAADYLRGIPEKNKSPATNAAIELLESGKPLIENPPGHMYEVNINADPEDFLDWDRPGAIPPDGPLRRWADALGYGQGEDASKVLGFAKTQKGSQLLKEAGIPGIKYLDQGSRAAGEGSRNYVVFDDALIDIVRKYGLAGLLAGAGAGATLSGSGEQEGGL